MPPAKQQTFLGRDRELALLDLELECAVSGEGRVVLVGGEPGVGKTWLVREELGRRAVSGEPVRTRWSRCSDTVGVPAFWPWRQLLGEGFARERAAPDPGAGTEAMDPFERIHAAAEDVFKACASRPLVLVIDDLQWADAESIQLLDALARAIEDWPLAVLATHRNVATSGEAAQGIAALSRHREVRRIDLRGWSLDETGQFLAARFPFAPLREDVEALHRVTAGNPYFVDELARTRVSLGPDRGERNAELPGDIQRLIEQRVEACDAATRALLELASVIGRDFSLALVHRLADAGETPSIVDALDRAIQARLLEPSDAPGQFRFVHALVARSIQARRPTRRLAVLHGRLGELLAAEPALRATGIAEVARHFATAESCRREAARGEAALAALSTDDGVLRAQLLAALTPLLVFEADRERPAALAREALRVAEGPAIRSPRDARSRRFTGHCSGSRRPTSDSRSLRGCWRRRSGARARASPPPRGCGATSTCSSSAASRMPRPSSRPSRRPRAGSAIPATGITRSRCGRDCPSIAADSIGRSVWPSRHSLSAGARPSRRARCVTRA